MRDLEKQIYYEHLAKRIDVIRALIGINGDLTMTNTVGCKDGSVILHGYKRDGEEIKPVKYIIGQFKINSLRRAKDFNEIYSMYKDIGCFEEV